MGIMVGRVFVKHYSDVIICVMASQITSLTIVYSTVYSGADQRKHQSSASMAFVRGIHRSPVNSPHKWRVTRKMFPFDDVSMIEFNLSLGGVSAISRTPVYQGDYLTNCNASIKFWKSYNNKWHASKLLPFSCGNVIIFELLMPES